MAEAETESDPVERSWTAREDEGSLLDRYFVLVVGACSGSLGGMGAFMANQSTLVPKVAPFVGRSTWALAVTAVGGAFAFLLARDVRESIAGMLLGTGVALVVMTVATVFPAYALPFSTVGRGVIVQLRLGRLVPTVFGVVVLVYWGGYLTAVSLLGYFET